MLFKKFICYFGCFNNNIFFNLYHNFTVSLLETLKSSSVKVFKILTNSFSSLSSQNGTSDNFTIKSFFFSSNSFFIAFLINSEHVILNTEDIFTSSNNFFPTLYSLFYSLYSPFLFYGITIILYYLILIFSSYFFQFL